MYKHKEVFTERNIHLNMANIFVLGLGGIKLLELALIKHTYTNVKEN